MKRILVVVDMQKDFVDGALGTPEAVAILPAVIEKIQKHEGTIIVTLDTHADNYLETAEGRKLPVPHCIRNTPGWKLNDAVAEALNGRDFEIVEKKTFGSIDLPGVIDGIVGDETFSVELIGLCTDICVVSNAILVKAAFPEVAMTVDAACCAGVTPETHRAALQVMRCCQIDVINE